MLSIILLLLATITIPTIVFIASVIRFSEKSNKPSKLYLASLVFTAPFFFSIVGGMFGLVHHRNLNGDVGMLKFAVPISAGIGIIIFLIATFATKKDSYQPEIVAVLAAIFMFALTFSG